MHDVATLRLRCRAGFDFNSTAAKSVSSARIAASSPPIRFSAGGSAK
jgi:hypothetical protein